MEIREIYTKSGQFNNIEEIQKIIKEINNSEDGTSFETIAVYVNNINGINILVELQVPTLFLINCGYSEIEMVAYTFEGDTENYMADVELATKIFDEHWETAMEQMEKFASEVADSE